MHVIATSQAISRLTGQSPSHVLRLLRCPRSDISETTPHPTQVNGCPAVNLPRAKRICAGLEELKKQPNVDPNRIAAIGYCFGGTTVLELARSGAEIAGVVSFNAGLGTPSPDDARNIKAKALVLHGADDPFVRPGELTAFHEEMRKGRVDWQLMVYGNAVHSFTQRTAGTDKSKGTAYDESADKRSWEAMKSFFNEAIGDSLSKW